MVLSTAAEAVRGASRISAYLAAFVLTACVALTMVDIFLRNFVNSAVPGIVELTQLAIMWCAFLSIPVGFVRDDHISVDLLSQRLPLHVQRRLALALSFSTSAFLAVATVWTWDQLWMAYKQQDSSPTLGVPMIWFWIPVVFGLGLSAVCAATHGLVRMQATPAMVPESQGSTP